MLPPRLQKQLEAQRAEARRATDQLLSQSDALRQERDSLQEQLTAETRALKDARSTIAGLEQAASSQVQAPALPPPSSLLFS
jgi:hypothetical protein